MRTNNGGPRVGKEKKKPATSSSPKDYRTKSAKKWAERDNELIVNAPGRARHNHPQSPN